MIENIKYIIKKIINKITTEIIILKTTEPKYNRDQN